MSIVASELIGIITIQGAEQGVASLERLWAATDTAGLKFAALAGGGALIAGAALVALGAKTTDMAANFQQGVTRLRTGAGDIQDSMTALGDHIKQVMVDTGTSSKPLIDAMYQILSANQRGAQAYNTLSVAAEGAKIEQAKVVDVAKALTTAMTDYGTKQFGATQYMNGYIRATQLGKITLEQLSNSMGPILPLAKNLGVSFADVAGAMATMTNAGIPADRAATSLRFLFQSLENPTKKAQTAMTEFGLNSVAVGDEMKKSLPGALEMVYKAALKAGPEGSVPFNRAVSDMIGGQRSLQAYLSLTGTHLKTFTDDSKAVAGAMGGSKTAVMGWADVQKNFNQQMDKAKASLEVLGITIGQALLPVMTKIVSAIAPIVVAVTNWLVKNNAIIPILGGLAALIGGTLIAALVALVAAFWPIFAIGAGIGVLVAGIILAVTHWGDIMKWVGGVFSAVGTFIHGVLSAIGSFVGGIFNAMGTNVHNALTGALNTVIAIWNAIKVVFGAALAFIKNLVGTVFSAIGSWFTWLYNHNTYIKALCDFIVKAFNALKAFIGAVFSAIGTFIHDRLVWIRDTVGSIFSAIGTWIHDRLSYVWNTVTAYWNLIVFYVTGKVTELKNNVGNAFSALGTAIHDKITAAWDWLKGFVSGWPSEAFNWGKNLIQGLINGIASMVGGLFSQIGDIAHNIASKLGFHSPPKEGPARDADKWMPNMMAMFTQGIAAGTPNLRRALSNAIGPMSTSLNVGTSFTGSYLPSGTSAVPSTLNSYVGARPTGSTQGQQPIILQIDGYQFARLLMPSIVSNIRNSVGIYGL